MWTAALSTHRSPNKSATCETTQDSTLPGEKSSVGPPWPPSRSGLPSLFTRGTRKHRDPAEIAWRSCDRLTDDGCNSWWFTYITLLDSFVQLSLDNSDVCLHVFGVFGLCGCVTRFMWRCCCTAECLTTAAFLMLPESLIDSCLCIITADIIQAGFQSLLADEATGCVSLYLGMARSQWRPPVCCVLMPLDFSMREFTNSFSCEVLHCSRASVRGEQVLSIISTWVFLR